MLELDALKQSVDLDDNDCSDWSDSSEVYQILSQELDQVAALPTDHNNESVSKFEDDGSLDRGSELNCSRSQNSSPPSKQHSACCVSSSSDMGYESNDVCGDCCLTPASEGSLAVYRLKYVWRTLCSLQDPDGVHLLDYEQCNKSVYELVGVFPSYCADKNGQLGRLSKCSS